MAAALAGGLVSRSPRHPGERGRRLGGHPGAGRGAHARSPPVTPSGSAIFALMGAFMSVVAGLYHRAERRLAQARTALAVSASEQRALEREEEVRQRYELLASHSRDIILSVRRRDGLILEANAAAGRGLRPLPRGAALPDHPRASRTRRAGRRARPDGAGGGERDPLRDAPPARGRQRFPGGGELARSHHRRGRDAHQHRARHHHAPAGRGGAAGVGPAQGRVPGGALARAAQPARAHPQRAARAGARGGGQRAGRARPGGAAAPDEPPGAAGGRPARRDAHLAGQGGAAARARSTGGRCSTAPPRTTAPRSSGAGWSCPWRCPRRPCGSTPIPVRLTQVVGNLLHNAAKFSGRPGACASRSRPRRPAPSCAWPTTGRACRARCSTRCSSLSSRQTRPLTRARGGLGLGLSLVKGLVELHGGSVTARNGGAGRGLEVTVRLPLGAPPSPCPAGRRRRAPERGGGAARAAPHGGRAAGCLASAQRRPGAPR